MSVSATTTPSSPRGTSCAIASAGWICASFTRSRIETTPASRPSSTTGKCRYPCWASEANASAAVRSGDTESGSRVIHSSTRARLGSMLEPVARRTSRSVRIPTGRSPSTTITEPTRSSRMRCATVAMVSSPPAVTAGLLMISPTVRALLVSAVAIDAPVRRFLRSLRMAPAATIQTFRPSGVAPPDQMSGLVERQHRAVPEPGRGHPTHRGVPRLEPQVSRETEQMSEVDVDDAPVTDDRDPAAGEPLDHGVERRHDPPPEHVGSLPAVLLPPTFHHRREPAVARDPRREPEGGGGGWGGPAAPRKGPRHHAADPGGREPLGQAVRLLDAER